ncbi:DUF6896 domain-containing protein [Streptomyces sp. NPDC057638]|uniref:DUF6896 domain-containing protein n=1 Tax=Streptomyces sp. NPDC057638 TaxID=3346190 RepID=UPI0036A28BBC
MMSDTSAEVQAYVAALSRVQLRALQGLPQLNSRLAQIVQYVRAGRMSRSGFIEDSSIEYAVHGNGCLFVTEDGWEVDVDFLPDGRSAFDAWRIQRFSASRGVVLRAPQDQLTQECRRLAHSGQLEERGVGWFAVKAEQPSDGR